MHKQANCHSNCLICHVKSFSWQTMIHVCPTYQTTVTLRLLMTSAKAKQATQRNGQTFSLHSRCQKQTPPLSNIISPFQIEVAHKKCYDRKLTRIKKASRIEYAYSFCPAVMGLG